MRSGQDRLHIGRSHEINVREKLTRHGWTVQDWGQGEFIDPVRIALVQHEPKVMWRWMPDLIAVRGRRIWLVDPKTDKRSDTPNFSIEIDALIAHKAMLTFGLPIVYVWQDMTVNTPDRLQVVRWQADPERGLNGGSGTPYALIKKAAQHPFEKAFGPEQTQTQKVAG